MRTNISKLWPQHKGRVVKTSFALVSALLYGINFEFFLLIGFAIAILIGIWLFANSPLREKDTSMVSFWAGNMIIGLAAGLLIAISIEEIYLLILESQGLISR